jgi:hypothetical protein
MTFPGFKMKSLILFYFLLLPFSAKANLLLQYGLNYSSQEDDSGSGKSSQSRSYNKAFIAASVNGNKTIFFGWNINSWSSSLKQGSSSEDTYSILEMGPRLQWFMNDDNNLYLTAEWNPYAKGEREKGGAKQDITGSGIGLGLGYRFRLSRLIGFGASLNYQSLSIAEEKTNTTETDVSDSVSNIMPMLELTILFR